MKENAASHVATKGNARPQPALAPRSIEERLLHPVALRAVRHAQAGGRIKAQPAETALKVAWGPRVLEAVQAFACTGDMARLVEALEEHWTALAHPLIFGQMVHLWRLQFRPTEEQEDIGGVAVGSEAEILPWGTKKAVEEALRRLVTAWCKSLLRGWGVVFQPPGWRVTRNREAIIIKQWRRRGRRRGVDYEDASSILWQLGEIKNAIATVRKERLLSLFRQTSAARRLEAAVEIVISVYKRLPWTWEYVLASGPPTPDLQGLSSLKPRHVPIPRSEAEKIARLALGTRTAIQPAKLIQALLAYDWYSRKSQRWEQQLHSVRGQIVEARRLAKENPELLF